MSDDAVVQEPEEYEDLRTGFHHALDEIRADTAKLAAGVTENIPRATEILLRQDLEGAEYLIRLQDADGSWSDPLWNGTGFPRVFMLKYHLYAQYFPLWALGVYRRARK